MPSQGPPRISPAVRSLEPASAGSQKLTGATVAPPVYRPQPAANSVPRSGFAAAPPAYRPGVHDVQPKSFTVQRNIQGAPISAQNPRIQLSAPPVYRPTQSAYQLKIDTRPYAKPLRASSVQRTPLPASLASRSMRGQMAGTIQRAMLGKEKLEMMFENAMADGDFDEVDRIEKLMSKLPGDSMPKTFGVTDVDSRDLTYKNVQIRFTFEAGKRTQLTKSQTILGKLMCGLGASCYLGAHSEIKVDSNGKEVWTSKGGNIHKTAPPIDHYGPDWKDRLSALEKKNYDVQTFATEGKKAYNQDPLRIVHMYCNSKRNGKS